MKKRATGRPEKAAKDKRSNMLRIRLTEAEREKFEAAAKRKSLDVSAWARMVLAESANAED